MKNYEKTYMFTKKDKGLFPQLLTVVKAVSDDETRVYMCGVKVEKDRIMATDGRRVHMMKNVVNLEEGFYRVLMSSKTKIILSVDDIGDNYPNIDGVTPDIEKMSMIRLTKEKYGNEPAFFLYKLIEQTDCYFSMKFIDDLPEGGYEIYFNPESNNKAVVLKCGDFTAVIMPLMKDE